MSPAMTLYCEMCQKPFDGRKITLLQVATRWMGRFCKKCAKEYAGQNADDLVDDLTKGAIILMDEIEEDE